MKSWIDLIGYRHEVVHTGVLTALLRDRTRGPKLAAGLTGTSVEAIYGVHPERRVPGNRGKADLVAQLKLTDGSERWLGIETKVDGDGTRDQLKATARPPDYGVHLALGLNAFKIEQFDLEPDMEQWRSIGPAEWLALLRATRPPDLLRPYVKEVAREAREHAAARKRAARPTARGPYVPVTRTPHHYLEGFAWLSEVRCRLDNPHWWWTKTLISGPLMGHWPAAWNRGKTERYLEFMSFTERRYLCLKVSATDAAQVRRAAKRMRAAAESLGWWISGPPRAGAKSYTVARLDVTDFRPTKAARKTKEYLAQIGDALRHPPA